MKKQPLILFQQRFYFNSQSRTFICLIPLWETTADLVKKGGKIVLVGNVHEDVPINQLQLNNNEVDLLSVFRYHGIYPLVLDAVASAVSTPYTLRAPRHVKLARHPQCHDE